MLRQLTSVMLTALVLVYATPAGAETPAGTAFTYQGRLNSGGSPASGDHDFEFGLYDALTAGVQVGTTVSLTTNVVGGLFAASLDFGSAAFAGDKRWLEIAVKPTASPTYTLLLPRAEVTPAPAAQYADKASTAGIALQAAIADTLDGIDSTGFSVTSHVHDFLQASDSSKVKALANGRLLSGDSNNQVTGNYATAVGGSSNSAAGLSAGVVGGENNAASALRSGILGGWFNIANQTGAAVVGGQENSASGQLAVVAGGEDNTASGFKAAVTGGHANTASGGAAIVTGGIANQAQAQAAIVAGGFGNAATGENAAVLGGNSNLASGNDSVAAGNRAKAANKSTFVWADSQAADFQSSNQDQFLVRAANGVGINTTSPLQSLHIGGTAGTHGIMFPDGTSQTTAFTGTAPDADTLDGIDSTGFAASAHGHSSLDAPDGSPTNVVTVDATGNLNLNGPEIQMTSTEAGINFTGPVAEQTAASHDVSDNMLMATSSWQSFTSTLTGRLTQAAIWTLASSANITVRIYSGEGTAGTLLAQATLPGNAISGYRPVTFPEVVSLSAGAQYTIFAEGDATLNWTYQNLGQYAGGRAAGSSSQDHVFYVKVQPDNASALYVSSVNGHVGLGTTSPQARLHVAGTAGTDGIKYPDNTLQTTAFTGAATNADKLDNIDSTGFAAAIHNHNFLTSFDGNPFYAVYADQDGKVGVGTEIPTAKLHVGGIAGTDGIKYPDGTLQKTAYPGYVSSLDAPDLSSTNVVSVDMSGAIALNGPALKITSDADGFTMGEAPVEQLMVSQTLVNQGQLTTSAWQSFTSTMNGRLTKLVIYFYMQGSPTVTMEIRQGEGAGGTVLSTQSFSISQHTMTIELAQPVSLTAGSMYTIHITAGANFWWEEKEGNVYAGGRGSMSSTRDFQFQVYVTTEGGYGICVEPINRFVGIGTASPAYQLQLSRDSAAKPGTSSWTIASDARLKDVGAAFTRSLDALKLIHPVKFNYKQTNPLGLPGDQEYVGVLAQDVQAGVPEAVSTDDKGYLHMNTDAVFWTVVNSVKELEAENSKLRDEKQEMEQRFEQRIEKLEKLLEAKK